MWAALTADPHRLSRFVEAQDSGHAYERALDELRRGRKTSHWMWFVFPQIAGLGHSATAQHFAVGSLAEARAYLGHEVLGARLRECAHLVAELPPGADAIFGSLDAMKLRSSMTLFRRAAPDDEVFQAVLDRHFDGEPDWLTEQMLGR